MYYYYADELFRTIFHSFEAGIANAISSSYTYEEINVFKIASLDYLSN